MGLTVKLPCDAQDLIPHRPPMLLVERLLKRDRSEGTGTAETTAPPEGFFLDRDGRYFPEYFIELVAQTAAAINGFDAVTDGKPPARGFLVGVDDFSWKGLPVPGEMLEIRAKKTFEFGAVTIMEGRITGPGGEIASGKVRVWEENK